MKKLLSLLLLASICFTVSPAKAFEAYSSDMMDEKRQTISTVLLNLSTQTECDGILEQIKKIEKRIKYLTSGPYNDPFGIALNGEPPESVKLEVKDLRARLISLKRKAERCNNIIPPSPPSVTPPSPPKVTTPYIPPDEDPNIDTSIPREDYIHELRDAPRA